MINLSFKIGSILVLDNIVLLQIAPDSTVSFVSALITAIVALGGVIAVLFSYIKKRQLLSDEILKSHKEEIVHITKEHREDVKNLLKESNKSYMDVIERNNRYFDKLSDATDENNKLMEKIRETLKEIIAK